MHRARCKKRNLEFFTCCDLLPNAAIRLVRLSLIWKNKRDKFIVWNDTADVWQPLSRFLVLMRKNTTAAAGRVLHGGTQGNRRDCERSACSGFMSANACLCRGDVVRQGGMDVTRAESPLRASQTPLTTPKWPTLPITHCSSHCGRETITQMVAYEHSSLCNNALGQFKSRLKCNLMPSEDSWDFVWIFGKSS